MFAPKEVSLQVEWIPELDRWMSVWGDEATWDGEYGVSNPRIYLPKRYEEVAP